MLKNKIQVVLRKKQHDFRGWFIKPIDGYEHNLSWGKGEIYVTAAIPNQKKGGDYSVNTNKWFTIIKGQAILKLEDIETKDRLILKMDSTSPTTVFIPCKVANIIENIGDEECIFVVYADKQYETNDNIPYEL